VRLQAWLAPGIVFGLALTVYGLTAPSGLTWAHASADGGDLITAARVLGVPHPSGYPTWTLLAALFSQLPLGTAAWRATLLSMLSGAAAAALVAATVPWLAPDLRRGPAPRNGISATEGLTNPASAARESPRHRTSPAVLLLSHAPALVAGLALAFAPLLWSQATVAEVYALHACLAAAALWALVRWQAGGNSRWAAAAGLFLGLGLGNHLTTVWLLPAVGILLWTDRRSGSSRAWASAALAAGLAAGLLVYLYLPLAAANDPPVNWGDPRTLEGLWWLVSGQLYQGYIFAIALADVPGRLGSWSAELWRSFLPWGVAAALFGLATLFQRNRSLATALTTSLLLGLAWAVSYNTSDSLMSLLPGFVILTLTLGAGLATALDWLASRNQRAGLAAALFSIALAAAPLTLHWQQQNLRSDQAAEQFYSQVLQHTPDGAVVLTAGDRATFALWYGRYGLGLRPDVTPVSRDLWALPSYRATVASQHPDLAGATPPADWLDLLQAVSQRRPLYLAQAGLADPSRADANQTSPGYRPELVLQGDGWALWRLER
jgi:hypothetical protein